MTALTNKASYRIEPDRRASPAGEEFDIVLDPISHPELGEIRIEENLFAVGRNEPPFSTYQPELVADLSRRHARIFSEAGAAYLADLGSKNGTTVNGVDVRQKAVRLHQDDEICFGNVLRYRVRLSHREQTQLPATRLVSLTLKPERPESGLQPIVITQFPFLVSKSDAAFSIYRESFPDQLNYLSRRHAHLFLKGGQPWVEDLGSTNGTFVSGKRLAEQAVPLADGDTLAFGGHHFVYLVSLQVEAAASDPTVTKLGMPGIVKPHADAPIMASLSARELPGNEAIDKTTFVASADSFLDIFCIDQGKQKNAEADSAAPKAQEDAVKPSAPASKRRGRLATTASEMLQAFLGKESSRGGWARWWVGALAILVAGVAAFILFRGSPDQQIRDLMTSGKFTQAAQLASSAVQRHPENADLKTLGTEALLKAYVPPWLAHIKANDFVGAEKDIATLKKLAARNENALSLIEELEWLGGLEKFMAVRGGMEAPVRIYADEAGITTYLRQWNDDVQRRQRDFARIASIVPEFADPYAVALSHLRKLQSDEAVYLSAIARLKTAIDGDLNKEQADTVESMLDDYAEKYPRLQGIDAIRQDLRKYLAVDSAARARDLPKVVSLLTFSRFATPQFQAKVKALSDKGALPAPEVVARYDAVSREWKAGHADQAVSALRAIPAGAWMDALNHEVQRKQTLLDRYAALQKARGSGAYDDRLIAFYGALDPDEDVYYLHAVEGELGKVRDKALRHAQELQNQAQAQWRRYRDNGSIASEQRQESAISSAYRSQAHALAQAREEARQARQLYTQLKADVPEPLTKLREDIEREVDSQRRSLMELDRLLEPGVLKAKLALLGRENDEERSSKTAN